MEIKVKRLTPAAKLPTQANQFDAGFDVYVVADNEFIDDKFVLQPWKRKVFNTDISLELPPLTYADLMDRSSMGSNGIHILGGKIDGGYKGILKVVLINLSDDPYTVKTGDKITQYSLMPLLPAKIVEVNELSDSARMAGSFGSSGR